MSETAELRAQTPVKVRAGKARKKKFIKKVVSWVLVLAILAGGGFALYRFLQTDGEVLGEIYATEAYLGSIQSKVSGSGVARSTESAAITLPQGGVVEEVLVSQGMMVMAGQPLYTVFSQSAQDTLDEAAEAVTALALELSDLQDRMQELVVRAPFAGKLTEVRTLTPGEVIYAGETVAQLVNDRQLRLTQYFSYAYENTVFPGQQVMVSVPAVMNNYPGTVEAINKVSYVSPEGGVHFELTVIFDNPGTLTAGMTASAVITGTDGLPVYPYEAGTLSFVDQQPVQATLDGSVESVELLRNYASVQAGDVLFRQGAERLEAAIEEKKQEVVAARAAWDAAKAAMQDYSAVAPIDGTVTSCTLVEGNTVKAGETVIIITNNATMEVTINVDDRNIAFVRPGSNVELDWNGQFFMGTVTGIDMSGAQQGMGMTSYPVTLSVENYGGQLMDGAWLQYSFVTSESGECILVPTTSVQYFSDKEGNRQSVVFVKRDSRPENVPELELPQVEEGRKRRFPTEEEGYYPVIVETGLSDAQTVEIVSGVSAGETVFVNFTVVDNSGSWS